MKLKTAPTYTAAAKENHSDMSTPVACAMDMREFTDYRPKCLQYAEIHSMVKQRYGEVTTANINQFFNDTQKTGELTKMRMERGRARMIDCIPNNQQIVAKESGVPIKEGMVHQVEIEPMFKTHCNDKSCRRYFNSPHGFGDA